MNDIVMFALEIGVPLALGLFVNVYLKGVTSRLLAELCGTTDRSEFWVKVTAVLMIAAPTALVLAFGRSDQIDASIGDVMRHALTLSLLGIVVVIGGLARTIWKTIPTNVTSGQPAGDAK